MIKCNQCNQEPHTNDMVSCKTPECNEYDLKYHLWEWNDLNQVEELVTNDRTR